MNKVRVVVTGVGVVCANGHSREEFWESVVAGKSSIGPIELFDTRWTPCKIAGEVKDFDPSAVIGGADVAKLNRSAQFAIVAGAEALVQSALRLEDLDPYRVGVVMGTCQGSLPEMRPETVTYAPFDFMHSSCDALAHRFALKGPRSVVSNACAAGANAVGLARDKIWSGEADVMLGGGTDALTFFSLAGFSSLQSLDLEPCSPYGRSSGLSLGEGAAVLVLESLELAQRRGAHILAELRGYGLSADAYHPTAPDPSGRGAVLAMRRALAQAALSADAVNYVNGHGTGTQANDVMERKAFRTVFGARAAQVPVSSTKSMVGHALGAAGAIEAAACVLAVERDVLPPTVNLPAASVDEFDFVADRGRPAHIDVVMSNNYAFGGSNASLVFSKPAVSATKPDDVPSVGVHITGVGAAGCLGLGVDQWWTRLSEGRSAIRPIQGFDRSFFRCGQAAESQSPPMRGFAASGAWRKMDRFERLCVASARLAYDDAKVNLGTDDLERVAVIFATGNGSFETMATFEQASRVGPSEANPSLFPHTALNAAAGHVCTTLGIRGPTSTVTAGGVSGLTALIYASELIRQGEADVCLVVSADQFCKPLLMMLDPWPDILTSGPVRPFDERADGTAMGEAAITFVLERSDVAFGRGIGSYGEVLGHGMTGDTTALGGMSGSAMEWATAMRLAVQRSGLDPAQIAYCAAAASGISVVDRAEALGLAQVFPTSLRVGAPKSVTGDCLAASGAIGVMACLLALNRGVLPHSINLERPVNGSEVAHLTAPTTNELVDYCLANSASFGGNYVSVIIGRDTERGQGR